MLEETEGLVGAQPRNHVNEVNDCFHKRERNNACVNVVGKTGEPDEVSASDESEVEAPTMASPSQLHVRKAVLLFNVRRPISSTHRPGCRPCCGTRRLGMKSGRRLGTGTQATRLVKRGQRRHSAH